MGNLSMLTANDQRQLLQEFNATDADLPLNDCIHSLFERQVQQAGDSVALVCGEQRLTYAELNARSNRLAHYLLGRGVTPETLVGVCLGREADLVVALMAILKAGGAYVPIDPNYPADRVAYMLTDASAPLVISHSSLAPMLLATVLYNVQFVPTAVVGAVWPEYFVVVVVLNAGARVVPANERGAALLCRTWALRGSWGRVPQHADGGGQDALREHGVTREVEQLELKFFLVWVM